MNHQPQIVVNWHVTEACNYHCKFCYAHWVKDRAPELWRDNDACKSLVSELSRFVSRNNLFWQGRVASRPRLNIAGGEPTLWKDELCKLVFWAVEAGFDVSLISNGSRPDALLAIAPKVKILGLSVDSTHDEGNLRIGRVDRKGRQINSEDLISLVQELRASNPALQIKVNTVVNAVNVDEDFSDLISRIAPDRWKILHMLPSYKDDLAVGSVTFNQFVERHGAFKKILVVEDNTAMVHSYLMVDPHGRFFQNRLCEKGYDYSAPILDVGIEHAFRQIPFDFAKFLNRYEISEGKS